MVLARRDCGACKEVVVVLARRDCGACKEVVVVLARRDCGRLVIGSPPRPRGCKWGRVGEAGRAGESTR